jgi:hypothetical protein
MVEQPVRRAPNFTLHQICMELIVSRQRTGKGAQSLYSRLDGSSSRLEETMPFDEHGTFRKAKTLYIKQAKAMGLNLHLTPRRGKMPNKPNKKKGEVKGNNSKRGRGGQERPPSNRGKDKNRRKADK